MPRFALYARLPRPLRWTARVLTTVIVVLVVAAIILTLWVTWTVRRSFPQLDGQISVPGLAGRVTVYRDRWGVPQIYGDTADDLFRAQGYVHAQDRFWEMDFRRHVTAGRLSELFGKTTLDADKVVRTLGWRRVAAQELPLLRPDTRRYLQDYADGVNAWLAGHTGARASLEYAVLGLTRRGYRPEPWTPVDSLAWLKAMAWDLRTNIEDELARALAAAKVPPSRVDQLYPPYPYDRNPAIVPQLPPGERRPAAHARLPGAADPATSPAGATLPTVAATPLTTAAAALHALPTITPGGSGIGSNSWVVAGSRTTTGKPLLANDPHLAPHMPSLWYQAGLHCRSLSAACPFDVVGFTFSGFPGVIIGHNNRLAWGFTNLGPDVTDLYVERVRGASYEFQGAWQPLATRVERIGVAGGAPVTITVRASRHGPLISDVMSDARRAAASTPGVPHDGQAYAVALRWTALDPGRTADAVFLMNHAQNWADFRAAAASFEVPAQNLVYADVDGNIGYQAPGKIPIRVRGDGRWPVPGWTGQDEWTGYIPFASLPFELNPPRGYIVTANNAVTGPDYRYLLTSDWSYGYRAARIEERIRQAGRLDVAAMSAIQLDTRSGLAPILVPALLHIPVTGRLRADQDLLRGWDFTQGTGSAPAAYFNAVWRHLLIRTFDDELPQGARPDGQDQWFEVVRGLLARPDDPWWDDVRTPDRRETRDDDIRAAMADADAELRRRLGDDPRAWRWGDLHTLELTNDTFGKSGIALIEWLFNRGPLHLAGGSSVVDATSWDAQKGYAATVVPSMRMVVDLADLDASRWVNLTGASGHAFAGNYADQAELWARGETTPMRASQAMIRREARHTLSLTPGR